MVVKKIRFTGALLAFSLLLCPIALADDGGSSFSSPFRCARPPAANPTPAAVDDALPGELTQPMLPECVRQLVDQIPQVRLVAPGILRGGQPTPAGLIALQKAGVKTIINLRNNPIYVPQEEDECRRLGVTMFSIPMDGVLPPSNAQIHEFLKIVQSQANLPVFIHCQHGQDRTGAMIGIYRIEAENWTAGQAYKEMLQNGFHPALIGLADAVFTYEQSKGRPPSIRPFGARLYELMDREFNLSQVNLRIPANWGLNDKIN